MREQYRAYLREAAIKKDVSEDRLIEIALGNLQYADRMIDEGYRPVYLNQNGERHPMDMPGGCMGDPD